MKMQYVVVLVLSFLLIGLASGERSSEEYREEFEMAKSELKEVYNDIRSLKQEIADLNATLSSLEAFNATKSTELEQNIAAERNASCVLGQNIAAIRSLERNGVFFAAFAILGFLLGFWACFATARILRRVRQ
jgi:hypothetical protein